MMSQLHLGPDLGAEGFSARNAFFFSHLSSTMYLARDEVEAHYSTLGITEFFWFTVRERRFFSPRVALNVRKRSRSVLSESANKPQTSCAKWQLVCFCLEEETVRKEEVVDKIQNGFGVNAMTARGKCVVAHDYPRRRHTPRS